MRGRQQRAGSMRMRADGALGSTSTGEMNPNPSLVYVGGPTLGDTGPTGQQGRREAGNVRRWRAECVGYCSCASRRGKTRVSKRAGNGSGGLSRGRQGNVHVSQGASRWVPGTNA